MGMCDLLDAYENDDMDSLEINSDSSFIAPLPPLPLQSIEADMNFANSESAPDAVYSHECCKNGSQHTFDPELKKKLNDTLSLLPVNMQEMLVEKMVSSIVSSEMYKNGVNGMTNTSSLSIPDPVNSSPITVVESSPPLNVTPK